MSYRAAVVTLLVTVLIPLRFSGALRLWAPAIGIVAGCLTAGLGFGIYDTARDAYEAGGGKYGLGDFSMQEIGARPVGLGIMTLCLG